jgi:hypothetical protein
MPRHAAPPFGLSSPLQVHAHRALRLFVTAGTSAAGLCLVIGSIVLVSSAASPGRVTRLTTESAAHRERRPADRGGARRPLPGKQPSRAAGAGQRRLPSRLIAAFSGHGDQTTGQFSVGRTARWQISWSYRCPPSVPLGLLIVEDASPDAIGASIDQSGAAGRGDTWLNPGGPTHRLVVISTCSWNMKVTQQR